VDAVQSLRVPDLHDKYGRAFEEAYVGRGKSRQGRAEAVQEDSATQLWRKMLSMLFETGHPWITFKILNLRSPQQHVGVVQKQLQLVHRDNPQYQLRRNRVCNLGSINMVRT